MMKRMFACLATGLFLVGVAGIAQGAGCNKGEDFFTEGPNYKRDYKKSPVVVTKVGCVDQASFYIEGMRISPCAKETKTIVTKTMSTGDFCTEGFSNEELKFMKLVKILNKTETAAGN